jgi:hypothetical protein
LRWVRFRSLPRWSVGNIIRSPDPKNCHFQIKSGGAGPTSDLFSAFLARTLG